MNDSAAPAIILVNPQMGENIGMCARAMLNCGVTDLRLVAPRDGWPNAAARSASSGAIDVIDKARVYATLNDAIADRTYVVATTARPREMNKPVLEPKAAALTIQRTDQYKVSTCAVVFGPERAGLTNDAVALCDAILNFPLNPEYASLNLSQAVLLLCYEWRQLQGVTVKAPQTTLGTKAEFDSVIRHLVDALEDSRFFTVDKMRPVILRNIRTTLQKAALSSAEIRGLHGMIKALHGKSWQ